MIEAEVAYALPARQWCYRVRVPEGSTVGDAIAASGVLRDCPEIDLAVQRVGVFGRLVQPDRRLEAGDRVEIYRPLAADPKEGRRRRARRSAP